MFIEKVNADLNDTLGNFIHRTLTFVNSHFGGAVPESKDLDADSVKVLKTLEEKVRTTAKEFENCRLQAAANTIMSISRVGNQYLNEKEPWNLMKKDRNEAAKVFSVAAQIVKALAIVSAPLIPFAAEETWRALNLTGSVHEQKWENALKPLPTNHRIAETKPLFRKIDVGSQELEKKLHKVRETLSKTA
jgi:methionyl-tRNA synthetase